MHGVAIGVKYQIEVGAGHDAAEEMCAAAWGFAKGNVITADIVRTDGRDTCQSGVATLSGNGGWNLALKNDVFAAGGALLEGYYTATRGNCSGSVGLEVGCDDPNCLTGDAMSCVCSISIGASGARPCPAECPVDMAVSIARL